MKAISVCFVCMGNICRSPTAEGVLRKQLEIAGLGQRVLVDSAGTHAHHQGQPPDPRATAVAKARGIDITGLRARPVEPEDHLRFDYLLAMDNTNLRQLWQQRPGNASCKPRLVLDYARVSARSEVPDPYYGGADGFEQVLELLGDAVDGLMEEIRQRLRD
ncbi:MAG: low molecular weight phosphotyrosine protein phosphatase [Gammaproteobacteria bacterium]|nr:low molecular weight phosphotyrosine protein phosphatase [Gammaproteobacteria bacterium]